MLKVSISKIFSLLAILLFFGRVAFASAGAVDRWSPYFSSEVQAKAVQSLKRDALHGLSSRFSVDGRPLAPIHTVEQLIERMGEFQAAIAKSSGDVVKISIDEHLFLIDRVPLGEGLTGIAYEIRGHNSVLKLPQPHAIAFKAMVKEAQSLDLYAELEKAGLPIARAETVHPLGIFAVKEKAPAMNLTEFLIQKKLIEVLEGEIPGGRPKIKKISDTQLQLALQKPALAAVARQIEDLLQARRSFDSLKLDLGPDNLHLEIIDGQVRRMVLVDLGASSESTKNLIDGLNTFSDYLSFSEKMIGRYVESGVFATRAAHTLHQGAKCVSAFGP